MTPSTSPTASPPSRALRVAGALLVAVGAACLFLVVGGSLGDPDEYSRPEAAVWLLAAMSAGCDIVLIASGAHALLRKRPSLGLTLLAGCFVLPTLSVHYVWFVVGYTS